MIENPVLGGLGKNTGVSFFQKLVPSLVSLALIVGALIFLFNLIFGAIQWMSSGGDKQGLEAAKARISNAIIGLVILFAIFAIIQLIEYFFHVSILTLDIGKLVIQ
jgi:hypothetical protein